MDPKQPSLFTRLGVVEAELESLTTLLLDLKLDYDALREDRDEWRWRAERLLADREKGAFNRWTGRVEDAFDAVVARLRGSLEKRSPTSAEGIDRLSRGWRFSGRSQAPRVGG